MKPTHVIVKSLLSAALLWAPAARALILTSWELPSNVKSLESEYAASTNIATVLNFGRAADGQSATMLYRNSNGKLAAVTVGEDASLSRFSLVKGGARGVRTAAAARVEANDGTENYDLTQAGFSWLGGTGGTGWGGTWRTIGGTAVPITGMTTDTSSHDLSLWTKSESGEVIVGRDLETPVESGQFSINAWLDVGEEFRGFAVYEGSRELLRYGSGSVGDKLGYLYAANGETVLFFDLDLPKNPTGLEYTLTWNRVGNGLSFELAESSGYWEDEHLDPIFVEGAAAVSAIALIVTGSSISTPEEIPELAFSRVSVSGTPVSAIPEPGTLALLAAGTALLAWRRRSRRA